MAYPVRYPHKRFSCARRLSLETLEKRQLLAAQVCVAESSRDAFDQSNLMETAVRDLAWPSLLDNASLADLPTTLVAEGEAGQTALDRYIAKPDPSYAYALTSTIVSPGLTTYVIDMTSQTWRSTAEVDKPLWQHWVQIIVPNNTSSDTALLMISGGSNNSSAPTQPNSSAAAFALQTNQVIVSLPMVPSQPLVFADETRSRSEDEIIAYSYDKFLDGGDEEWPVLLPMVKSAVRAMDTAQDFLDANTSIEIAEFFVTGASKRGWTTWLTAAVDQRVVGIVPTVIDVLNMQPSIDNHRSNYAGVTNGIIGGYSEEIHDYTELGIFDRFDTPRGVELAEIVDPYSYRDRYTMPKYILNSAGDQFFTPDSSQFYIHDLPGPTYMRYVPNTGHGLNADAAIGAGTFVALVDADVPLPQYDWTVEGPNANVIRVNTVQPPTQVNLWQASNPDALDFRMFIQSTGTVGPVYTSTPLTDQGGGEYVGTVPVPDSGGTAFFVELVYNVFGQTIRFTTEARIARAQGPELLAIRPDAGGLLNDGDTLHVAPGEFNLLFQGAANLDPTTIRTDTIKLVRSGGDGSFAENNEIEVAVGYVGLVDPQSDDPADRQRLVLRPASSAAHNATDPAYAFPDDLYQLQIIGSGANPLTNLVGTPFNDGNDLTRTFRLDRGAQVVAVVPQPISLGSLSQASNEIVVYFDDQVLDTDQAIDPSYYLLIHTAGTLEVADDVISLPDRVVYDPLTNTAVLEFADDLPEGTYRLQIGQQASVNQGATINLVSIEDDDSTLTTAMNIGAIGAATITVSAQIQPQSIPLPPLAGSEDEPGHRQIQREQHIGATGTTPTLPSAISTRQYYFPATLGTDTSGNPFPNLITEAEKQIVREIYEIYARQSGYEFIEATGGGTSIGKGDLRSLNPAMGPDSGVAGLGGAGAVVLNGAIWDQADRFFGDGFTNTMFHEIGHSLGLGHAYDQPANMGGGVPNDVLPGDHDIVHLQRIVPPNSTDIDLYRFDLTEPGRLQVETIAERLATPSLLNTVLQLYRQTSSDTELVAQNDQYFGADSFLDLTLAAGTYFVGVTSTGNTNYDPRVPDSGFGGTTDGAYELKFAFEPTNSAGSLRDADGTLFDGDADGLPGGVYSFWFQASDPATTIYVDKANDTTAGMIDGTGSLADPLDNIDTALKRAGSRIVISMAGADSIDDGESFVLDDGLHRVTFTFGNVGPNAIDISAATTAQQIAGTVASVIDGAGLSSSVTVVVTGRVVQISGIEHLDLGDAPTLLATPNLVRIVGNSGIDHDVSTIADNRPYLIGSDTNGNALSDGADFLVPQGVTVMIGAGALLKLRKANLDAGSSGTNLSRSQGAIQVLGTPNAAVTLRSFHDDSVGGNSDGAGPGSRSGDFGGIVFRDDSDWESAGIFLNYLNHADIKHGGGKVFVEAQESVYNPVHLVDARPTISFNRISSSDNAAMSANPDSFEETDGRIGPDIDGNFLTDNTIDGLFIRVLTPLGSTLDELTVSGRLDDTDITHVLTENLIIAGGAGGPLLVSGSFVARPGGRLRLDPGIVLKLSAARIEAERGSGSLIAEGTIDRPVIFTSLGDDRYGGSGSFDTGNSPGSTALPGDWGGLYFGQATSGSIDHAMISFGGGSTSIEGGAASFNAIEVHQADLRISNSLLQFNDDGNDSADGIRQGRGANFPATIYVRGSQPIIVDNVITDNFGPAININANSLRFEGQSDPGRSTGPADPYARFADNHGPLIRLNRLENNQINGMVVRGEEMTTEGIWDDTDIVHVLFNQITVDNHHTYSGLTLQSSNSESLVVKLASLFGDAGFTATGTPVETIDRIGGTIHVLGTVGHPVILTDLNDDSVGAGFTPGGQVMVNTNNSPIPTEGTVGGWRGLLFDEFSNDRNVAVIREQESPLTVGVDFNSIPSVSQGLGTLAPNQQSGDENRRLGFEVNGFISPDNPRDIDVYNFSATPGTGIWIDIDRTNTALDAIVEVVSANGIVLARSMRSADPNAAGSLNAQSLQQQTYLGGDHYTQNFRDPGLYYVLPGTAGTLATYYIRVRSNPATAGSVTSFAGESRGEYSLQIRQSQVQEFPGSTVKFADIRYAETAIDVRGLPAHSPLIGEAGELIDGNGNDNNNTAATASVLVNLLETDIAALGIAGELSSADDVDWYQFDLQQTGVQVIANFNDSAGTIGVVFDIDYADGAVRGDTTIAVFDSLQRLIYVGRESNIADDQSSISSANLDNLSRGSLGKKDPYIGPIHLSPGGSYYVAVISDHRLPSALTGVFQAVPTNPFNALVRLEPVNSVTRIVEDHIGQQGYTSGGTILPTTPSGLFDISSGVIGSGVGVDANVTPLSLQDVVLYVATDTGSDDGDGLYTVDPFQSNPIQTRVTNSLIADGNDIQDIVIRSDGRMFGYQQLDSGIGALVELDPSNMGTVVSTQTDNIAGVTGRPAALTFKRTGTTGPIPAPTPSYDVYYAVSQDIGGGATTSALYRATETGDATDQPPSGGNPSYGLVGDLSDLGMERTAAVLQISDGNAPATTSIRLDSKRPVSSAAPITLNITRADNGNAVVVTVVDTTINLQIGLMGLSPLATAPTAQQIVDAINGDPAANDLVVAQIDSGNGIQQAIQIPISSLTLRSDFGLVTGLAMGDFAGRTELFGVTDQGEFLLIDQDSGNVVRRLNVNQALGINVAFTGLTLGPQNVENGAYKNTLFASTSSGQVYALNTERIYDVPIDIIYAPNGPLETFDLLPRAGDPNLSVTGLMISGDTNGGVTAIDSRVTVDPSAYAALPPGAVTTITLNYTLSDFNGKSIPQVATIAIGDTADHTSNPDSGVTAIRPLFDADGDGVAESFSATVSGMFGAPVGLAFSPLDFNLWHPTNQRGGVSVEDLGHGIFNAPDGTRGTEDLAAPGATSFHFGFEQWQQQSSDAYLSYNGVNAQFGILTDDFHRDLSSNPNIVGTYNFPGGGYGSLTTDSFSLAGSVGADRPTLYFNYFLETENHAGSNLESDAADPFRDSARVFMSRNGGNTWELVATNNGLLSAADTTDTDKTAELPGFLSHLSDAGLNSGAARAVKNQIVQELFDGSGVWRQARVDLSSFAGASNLMMRIDFSTAGAIGDPSLGTVEASFGELTSTERSIRSLNNAFEGFYVDDFIVGYAERGEMVTGATPDAGITNLFASGARTQDNDPEANADILRGAYQLEVRRTEEYINAGDESNSIGAIYDTNIRHIETQSGLSADSNRQRAQGVFILDSNFISDSAVVGINVQPGTPQGGFGLVGDGSVPHPGSNINFPQLNQERLVPGIVIQNNVIAGSSGIRFAGENSPNSQAPVPFGRIVNNTLVGDDRSGIGIEVIGRASPTLLNNLLTDLGTAIVNQGVGTIIRSNFFQNNVSDENRGTASIVAPALAPLFLDPDNRNYILAASSLAIDSSQNTEQDRLNYRNFKNEIGIPPSPINAPDRDIYGQLRVDSNATPGGGGSDVFKDRGAIDRADTDAPYAVLLNPIDNDPAGQDRNSTHSIVYLSDSLWENFTLLLGDGRGPNAPFEGTGVDGLTVDNPADESISAQAIRITQNQKLLQQGIDYTVGYDPLTGALLLTPLSTLWDQRSVYNITLDNSLISDKVGNHLRANQDDGSTQFIIVMPEVKLDFGDALSTYGTLLANDGAHHTIVGSQLPGLGTVIDSELDGQSTNSDDAVGVDDEDGLLIGRLIDGTNSYTVFTAPDADPNDVQPSQVLGVLNPDNPAGADVNVLVRGIGFLDGWIDFDHNGVFDTSERVFDSIPVSGDPATGDHLKLNIKTPATALSGLTWMRMRISDSGNLSPTGLAISGEVEDYPVEIYRFTTADPNDPPVFDITAPLDAGVPTLDRLEQDDFAPIVIEGFAENIFPGSPTALDETVTQSVTFSVIQTGGPSVLMSRPPVLTATGTLTLFPVANAVGAVVYTVTLSDHHPTDPQSTSKTFVVNLRPVNDAPGLNPSTVPSSDTNSSDSNDSYTVASDGTITYRLREDNAQVGGVVEPFFIPLHAATSGVFNRIGLMDVLTVGPTNESDGTPGGSQTLSLIRPGTDHPNRIVGFTVQQITDNNVIDEKPQISGSNVVWAGGANSPPFTREIFFWDGTTTTQVTDNNFTDVDPQVSGNNVTWWGHSAASEREIFFWDGNTTTQVTNDLIRDENPRISGSTVVWEHRSTSNFEIYKWNGASPQVAPINISDNGFTDTAPQIDGSDIVYQTSGSGVFAVWRNDGAANVLVSSAGSSMSNPQVDGDRVVWEQFAPGADTEIYYFDGTQTIQLTDNALHDFQPQISGNNIVWRGGTFPNIEIYMYDGFEIKQITNNSFTDFNPQIDGNIIVWQGNDGNDDEIFAWDGSQITQLTDNDYPDTVPQISGNQIVWQAQSKGSGDGIEIFHAELTLGYAATELGGSLTPVYDGNQLIGWNYTPPADFNLANGGVDSLTYEVTDDGTSYDLNSKSLFDDPKTRLNRVEFVLAAVNDPPVFDIDAPSVAGIPTLNILESDNATAITISNFALNIGPGPITAVDETSSQQVTFSISEPNPSSGLMSQLPQLTSDGALTLFPIANAVGTATYTFTLTDDHPTDPRSTSKTFTFNLQPVNDPPGLNPSVVPSTATNPSNADDSYSVASGGTITYRLREDNTQSAGVTEPFFIPWSASTSGGYNRIGLLDVFTVGPANESDDTPGGSQSLSPISPTVATSTLRGGTLTPVAGGWHYIPPADFNFLIGGVDSFSYEVGDNGNSYDLETGTLVADPQRRTNRVDLVLAPVNDAPLFDLSTDRIIVVEDSPQFSLAGFATNISGGPVGTANDENDLASLQALTFTIRPLDFDAADMSAFFSNPPVLHSQTGRLSFRTAANVFGSYRFEVRLIDGGTNDPDRGDVNQSDPQLLTIHVGAKNDPPMIQPNGSPVQYTLNEDGTILIAISDLIDVFAPGPVTMFADESVDGTPGGNQNVSLADPVPMTTTAGGTLQLLSSGGPVRLLYTPRANFNGTDSFVYTVTDDGVTVGLDEVALDDPRTATQTVSLIVIPNNDPPEFNLVASVQSTEDAGPVRIDDWATDVLAGPSTATDETNGPSAQGLSFQFTQVGGDPNVIVPGSISATIDPQTRRASLFYQSAPDANGTATFQVVLQDDGPSDSGNGDRNVSAPQTFTINVAAVNDPPSFTFISNDPLSVPEDSSPHSIALLENISPGPADEASQSVVFEVQPLAAQYASLFASLPTIDSSGVLRFTTAPHQNTGNINGPVLIRVLARDSAGSQSNPVSFQIIVSEVHDRPVANGDSFDSDENTVLRLNASQLLANDVDPDLQTNASELLRIQLAAQSQTSLGAMLTYNEQMGQIVYDPTGVAAIQAMTTGDSIVDSFSYWLIDATGLTSDTVFVSFNIAGVNDAPILVPDLAFLETEGSTSINVLANDRDIDGSIDPTSLEIVGEPEFGTIVFTAEGVVLYTPKVDIPAQHWFAYTVADDLGLRSEPLPVMVLTNPAPTTGNDFAGTFKGESIQVHVLANDTDADGLDLASLVIVNGPARGHATAQSDGTVLYEPDAEFVGSDSFTYQISDTPGRPSRVTTVNTQVVNSRLQNPRLFGDVNADGRVTAQDALLIINHLRNMGNVSEVPVLDSDRGPNHYDVNGNQVITATDALRVVNALRTASGEPEAKPVSRTDLDAQPTRSTALPPIAADALSGQVQNDQTASELAVMVPSRPTKIVSPADQLPVSRHLIDTIAHGRTVVHQDEDSIRDAIDAVMASLM